jgi:hypothetical protein
MWNKLFKRDSVAAIATLSVSAASFIANFVLEGWTMQIEQWLTPLGIASVMLFIGGISLFVYNFFRRELKFRDKQQVVEDRKKYLASLKDVVNKRLSIAQQLRIKAIRYPLKNYWERYIKNTMPFIVTKQKPKTSLEITRALWKHHLHTDNHYYTLLKDNDTRYSRVVTDYNTLFIQIGDRKLKAKLNWLWRLEHTVGSLDIFTSLSINDFKIPHSSRGIKAGRFGKKLSDKALFEKALKEVDSRIDYLISGEDL